MKNSTRILAVAALATGLFTGVSAQWSGLQGLVGCYDFDQNVLDGSGRGNNGTWRGTEAYDMGQIGMAAKVSYDKGLTYNNYISLGKAADFNFGATTDFSFSFWTKFGAGSWDGDPAFISNKNWSSGSNTGYVLATDGDGRFQWNYREAGRTRRDYDGPAGTMSTGNFAHVVVTFDRDGQIVTFINGTQVNSTAAQGGIATMDAGLETNIGQDGTGAYTDGGNVGWRDGMLIDDLGIWNRVVTAQEAAEIYAAGLNGVALKSVPEPATMLALGAGLAALAARRRK